MWCAAATKTLSAGSPRKTTNLLAMPSNNINFCRRHAWLPLKPKMLEQGDRCEVKFNAESCINSRTQARFAAYWRMDAIAPNPTETKTHHTLLKPVKSPISRYLSARLAKIELIFLIIVHLLTTLMIRYCDLVGPDNTIDIRV
jgi:hypothetical protein